MSSCVLIVEDDEQVRVLAESFLQGEGHETLSAATLDQAIALLEGDKQIHLLFVDLGIQGDPEAGLKIASMAVEKRPELKVLYTSARRHRRHDRSFRRKFRLSAQAIYNRSAHISAAGKLQLEAQLADVDYYDIISGMCFTSRPQTAA